MLTVVDELLSGEIFDTLLETKVLIERWRREYNQARPDCALNYRAPAPETQIRETKSPKESPRDSENMVPILTQKVVPQLGQIT
jgi:hypothetical protein